MVDLISTLPDRRSFKFYKQTYKVVVLLRFLKLFFKGFLQNIYSPEGSARWSQLDLTRALKKAPRFLRVKNQ